MCKAPQGAGSEVKRRSLGVPFAEQKLIGKLSGGVVGASAGNSLSPGLEGRGL